MATTVIAISGKRRSGKNTAASAIRQALQKDIHFPEGQRVEELAFADPIKRCVGELFGFSEEQLDGDLKEKPDARWDGVTPRRVLQFFGTEMMQFKLQELLPGLGRHFWTRCLVEKIRGLSSSSSSVVAIVTDLRFRHEWEALRAAFGDSVKCVKIVRVDDDKQGNDDGVITSHASETDMDGVVADAVVYNDFRDLESFQKLAVDSVVRITR